MCRMGFDPQDDTRSTSQAIESIWEEYDQETARLNLAARLEGYRSYEYFLSTRDPDQATLLRILKSAVPLD